MFEEKWKIIEDYEKYSVSNLGNIRNNNTGKKIKGRENISGYLSVHLSDKNNKRMNKSISRIVAIAFLENIDNLPEVDHINQIKIDNRVENLRWISRENNQRNKSKWQGTSSKYKGISFDNSRNKWRANIYLNGKHNHIGRFSTEEEAYDAWCNVVIENNLQEFYNI
jgi:hypothetical protein